MSPTRLEGLLLLTGNGEAAAAAASSTSGMPDISVTPVISSSLHQRNFSDTFGTDTDWYPNPKR